MEENNNCEARRTMPTFDIETEEITVFDIGERYTFKTYFDEDQLFKRLEKYYNKDKYRFEIPECDLEEVRQVLDEYYYELDAEDSVEGYCVVVDRKSKSANTLKNSVMKKHKGEYEILVMKDKLSKRQAVEKDAVSLEKSEVGKEDLEWKPQ
ncbi:MAG: hypothetical protein ABEJ72_07085 [Candidatus Aenigmatarchaeota archaeon]